MTPQRMPGLKPIPELRLFRSASDALLSRTKFRGSHRKPAREFAQAGAPFGFAQDKPVPQNQIKRDKTLARRAVKNGRQTPARSGL